MTLTILGLSILNLVIMNSSGAEVTSNSENRSAQTNTSEAHQREDKTPLPFKIIDNTSVLFIKGFDYSTADRHETTLQVSDVRDGVFLTPKGTMPGMFTPRCTRDSWEKVVTMTGNIKVEFVSDEIGCHWQFLKPNITFEVGDYSFRSLACGSYVSFRDDGVRIGGFEVAAVLPTGTPKILFQPQVTSVNEAAYYGNIEWLNGYLSRQGQVDCRDKTGKTPLMWAALGQHPQIAEKLLQKGAGINEKDQGGWTALMYSSQLDGSYEMVQLLLGKGANVNLSDPTGTSALLAACAGGNEQIVSVLLKAGAKAGQSDLEGVSALMYATERGFEDIVKVLIEKGADVNAKSSIGVTALILASRMGQANTVELLLKSGADINARAENGWTALGTARSEGRTDIVRLLEQAGAKN